jgi:hypothetical protein
MERRETAGDDRDRERHAPRHERIARSPARHEPRGRGHRLAAGDAGVVRERVLCIAAVAVVRRVTSPVLPPARGEGKCGDERRRRERSRDDGARAGERRRGGGEHGPAERKRDPGGHGEAQPAAGAAAVGSSAA